MLSGASDDGDVACDASDDVWDISNDAKSGTLDGVSYDGPGVGPVDGPSVGPVDGPIGLLLGDWFGGWFGDWFGD